MIQLSCAHTSWYCVWIKILNLNQNFENLHLFCSEISLFLENIEQYQDNCEWSLDANDVEVANTAMVHPSPHPGWCMEQALLSWMQPPKCRESSFYWACGWQQENRGVFVWFLRKEEWEWESFVILLQWVCEKSFIFQESYKYQWLQIEMVVEKRQCVKAL